MKKTIIIDGREVEFAANAATPFRFRQIFKKDLFAVLGNEQKAQEEGIDTVAELGYVMAKQAEKADMNKLNEESFIEWLEQFGAMAFMETAEDILNVYLDTTASTAKP